MRVRLSDPDRKFFFKKLKDCGLDTNGIAEVTGVSIRTANNWKRGTHTFGEQHFTQLMSYIKLSSAVIQPEYLDDWWNNAMAGTKGAIARQRLHGPLGTVKSRCLGGMNSYETRKHKVNDIFAPKVIIKPRKNRQLAEFIGVMIGDGGLTKYQATVSSNTVDDAEYIIFVTSLFKKLFGTIPVVVKKKESNCTTITVSSVMLVRHLNHLGLHIGNKLHQGLDVPQWILDDRPLAVACLRGIFDTDGGVYHERHKIKHKVYSYPRLAFVSASSKLRQSIFQILTELEFSPKIRNNRSVTLEKRSDIIRYFQVVGSSNPKHMRRLRGYGEVG